MSDLQIKKERGRTSGKTLVSINRGNTVLWSKEGKIEDEDYLLDLAQRKMEKMNKLKESKFEQYLNEWVNPMFKDIHKKWNITGEEATKLWGKIKKEFEDRGEGDKVSLMTKEFQKRLREKYKEIKKV